MHGTVTQGFNGAIIFDNAQDMLLAMFGPDQHDWHVTRYRIWLKDMARTYEIPFWDRAQILAAVRAAKSDNCPGHVASAHDPKICDRCGIHVEAA
jgi:hypothetical protein